MGPLSRVRRRRFEQGVVKSNPVGARKLGAQQHCPMAQGGASTTDVGSQGGRR